MNVTLRQPHKRTWLVPLLVIASCAWGILPGNALQKDARTGPIDFHAVSYQKLSNQIDLFFKHLIKIPSSESIPVFDKYASIIEGELDRQRLYYGSYKEVADLLDVAARESIDALTLFTLPPLLDPNGTAIIFDEKLLEQVGSYFDFHGLFNIITPPLEGGPAVKMKFLVTGQGKFIVGYNRNAKIKHADYNFATGKYDYKELFMMESGKDSQGNPGLFNIKGMTEPNGKWERMKGPFNVDIHSLALVADGNGRSRIRILYDLFGIKQKTIDPIPIERLDD